MTDPMDFILSALGPSLGAYEHAQNPHADTGQTTHLNLTTALKTLATGSPASQGVHIFYQDKMKRMLAAKPSKKILFPRKSLCNRVVTNQQSALEWLKARLKKGTSPDLESTLRVLEREVESYTTYVRNHILPRCTEVDQTRRQTYVEGLRSRSILFSPEQIFASAQKWVKTFDSQAKETLEKIPTLRAKEKDLFPVAAAFQALSAVSFPDGQPSLPTYRNATSRIFNLSPPKGLSISENVKHKILESLKESDVLDVTFSAQWTDSDQPKAAAILVPRIRRPFRQLQDFVFPAAASLAAVREVYPGKAFLFHKMSRHSTSTARSVFAQRSRILEGWGLWALQTTLDQLDPTERLIALIYLLYQAQRALHESAIALGQSSEREFGQNLLRSLGLSAPTAQSNANMVDAAPGFASEPFAYWLAFQQALQPAPDCALRTYLEDPLFPFWLSADLLSRTCPLETAP